MDNKSSVLLNKKISLIGDSITEYNYRAAKNWCKWLEEECGCIVQNLGISWTGFTTENSPYIYRINSIDPDVDIIGVAISLNDLDAETEMGEVTDNTSNTICGAANLFFKELLEHFPNVPVIAYIENPWEKYRKGIRISDDYVRLMADVCANFGIPFYDDLYSKGSVLKPWIQKNREEFFTADNELFPEWIGVVDTDHPNSKGHRVIFKFLRSKFEDNVL